MWVGSFTSSQFTVLGFPIVKGKITIIDTLVDISDSTKVNVIANVKYTGFYRMGLETTMSINESNALHDSNFTQMTGTVLQSRQTMKFFIANKDDNKISGWYVSNTPCDEGRFELRCMKSLKN
jgi:hypothetical protein